ncbi:hypothetical protein ACFV7R_40350 [Streptomyces sp. NPDC059866]|uniref:hypothetical protein n=1 Tax=Streptomyces sp. NPDC059866 TaxID=3346978 RepID=UPI0036630101
MTETQMLQRVVAILTQAREMADLYGEDRERDDLDSQGELIGELIAELLEFDAVTPASSDSQDVADAVARSIQSRMILMAGCFSAAFARLAIYHDRCDADASSAEVLRRMVIEWERQDDETT